MDGFAIGFLVAGALCAVAVVGGFEAWKRERQKARTLEVQLVMMRNKAEGNVRVEIDTMFGDAAKIIAVGATIIDVAGEILYLDPSSYPIRLRVLPKGGAGECGNTGSAS